MVVQYLVEGVKDGDQCDGYVDFWQYIFVDFGVGQVVGQSVEYCVVDVVVGEVVIGVEGDIQYYEQV